MNVKLLRKIAKVIQEKPRQFDMDCWHFNPDNYASSGRLDKNAKACGTSHCIAGWVHVLSGEFPRTSTESAATKILGIDTDQAERLFYERYWPSGFDTDAAGAAARIEHFIKTKGAE